MSNNSGITYVGMTNDIYRRVSEHKTGLFEGFSKRYGTKNLVYVEEYGDVYDALYREKQIKTWRKEKKRNLIKSMNPRWQDLSEGWYEE
jgi:putative endonuclease